MAVTIGSVTEGNANAEEIKNNLPDSELYEKNKKYLQGSLVKFNDKIYLAKRNVPSDVDLDNPYYWEIFMDAADSKRVDELFKTIGDLADLETESKDTLVAAINEVNSIRPDWDQNDETASNYIKHRPGGYIEERTTPTLDIYGRKQDGINKLTNVSVFADNFTNKSSIDVEIAYSSGTINRTLTQRYIPEGYINTSGAQIYGNAHLIDATQPDTGEDLAMYKEVSIDSAYGIGWHIWATSVPSGDVEVAVVEKTMNTIPFASEFIPWETSPTANSVLYTAQSLTEEQRAQARTNIGAGTSYTLPQASPDAIGGVKADSAEVADTQPVRVGGDGKLYTAPGGTDISLGLTSAAVGQIIKIKAVDESGKPTAWEAAGSGTGGSGKLETFDGMTLLASGVIVSGTAAGTKTDTGVTYAAFKQWHRVVFIRRCASNQGNFCFGYGYENNLGFRNSNANMSVTYEHIDGYLWKYHCHATDTAAYAAPLTAINSYTKTLWAPSFSSTSNCNIDDGYIDIRCGIQDEVANGEQLTFTDENTFKIKNWAALTADVSWYIYGLTQEAAQ